MAPSISAGSVYIGWLRCVRVSFRSDKFFRYWVYQSKVRLNSYFWNDDAFLEPSIISKRAAPCLKWLTSVLLIIQPYHSVGARHSRATWTSQVLFAGHGAGCLSRGTHVFVPLTCTDPFVSIPVKQLGGHKTE